MSSERLLYVHFTSCVQGVGESRHLICFYQSHRGVFLINIEHNQHMQFGDLFSTYIPRKSPFGIKTSLISIFNSSSTFYLSQKLSFQFYSSMLISQELGANQWLQSKITKISKIVNIIFIMYKILIQYHKSVDYSSNQ